MTDENENLRKIVSGVKGRVSDKLGDLWWWFLIRGLLALGLALFASIWPHQTVGLLVKLLGGYLLFDGALGVVGTFRSVGKGNVPMVAIVGLVMGAFLLFWTGLSVQLFLILVGAWALIQGVGMFLSSRNKESDPESRNLVGIVGSTVAAAGLVLVLWPNTGVVTVSWLLAGVAFVLGSVMVYVAIRLRRVSHRLRQGVASAE
jgi:uncharacterized membrane protein HdeD (DUF308 family)